MAVMSLAACQPKSYDVILCQTGDLIGIMAKDDGWFSDDVALYEILFYREGHADYNVSPPIEEPATLLWAARAPENPADPNDETQWMKGNLFYIDAVPKSWVREKDSQKIRLSNSSLQDGQLYSVSISGHRNGDASFRFGEDQLPACTKGPK